MKNTDQVDVSSIRMPFFNMVFFMVKWFFASIVALLVVAVIISIAAYVLNFVTGAGFDVQGTFTELSSQIQGGGVSKEN
jgi:hypothetical protein